MPGVEWQLGASAQHDAVDRKVRPRDAIFYRAVALRANRIEAGQPLDPAAVVLQVSRRAEADFQNVALRRPNGAGAKLVQEAHRPILHIKLESLAHVCPHAARRSTTESRDR